jgi:hypothetical protein
MKEGIDGNKVYGVGLMDVIEGRTDMKLIAFTGLAGSGKSECAKLTGYQVVSFSAPIKQMLSCLGLDRHALYGADKEKPIEYLGGVTARTLMQKLGTEFGREMIHPDIWVKWMERVITSERYESIAIDDVRFDNEIKMVRRLGGKVIRVTRPGVAAQDHVSEIVPEYFDGEVLNGWSVRQLRRKLDTEMERLGFPEITNTVPTS